MVCAPIGYLRPKVQADPIRTAVGISVAKIVRFLSTRGLWLPCNDIIIHALISQVDYIHNISCLQCYLLLKVEYRKIGCPTIEGHISLWLVVGHVIWIITMISAPQYHPLSRILKILRQRRIFRICDLRRFEAFIRWPGWNVDCNWSWKEPHYFIRIFKWEKYLRGKQDFRHTLRAYWQSPLLACMGMYRLPKSRVTGRSDQNCSRNLHRENIEVCFNWGLMGCM